MRNIVFGLFIGSVMLPTGVHALGLDSQGVTFGDGTVQDTAWQPDRLIQIPARSGDVDNPVEYVGDCLFFNKSTITTVRVPVVLPMGSVVTSVGARFMDNSSDSDIQLRFVETVLHPTGVGEEGRETFTSSGAEAQIKTHLFTPPELPLTIASSVGLQVEAKNTSAPWSGLSWFCGVEVGYVLPSDSPVAGRLNFDSGSAGNDGIRVDTEGNRRGFEEP